MAWTYLEYDENGDRISGALPPQGAIVLVFEALRWSLAVGFLEPSRAGEGYTSILDPKISDDCCWLAWAPLNEAQPVDMKRIGPGEAAASYSARCTLHGVAAI